MVSKYYDWSRGLMLNPQKDGCRYEEWDDNFRTFPFTIHPKGFLVFLSPAELENSDEYKEDDPYTVEENIESGFHQRRIQCTLELIKSGITGKEENVRILDLGCGKGYITSAIQECFPLSEISGLDYSLSAIKYAVEAFHGIDFVVGNAYTPPYLEEYFDIVVCNNLWEHIPDPLLLLEKIRRIIKVEGFLIISTPSRYRIENLIRVVRGKSITFMSTLHVTEYSVGQVIEQIKFGKFEVVKTYSKPLINERTTMKSLIVYKLLLPLARKFLENIGSHHSLESTVFFLAKRCQ